jgi:hypothetical protein
VSKTTVADFNLERGLALVGQLTQAVAEVSRREEQLTRDLAERRFKIQRKCREHAHESKAYFEAQIAEARTAIDEAEAGARTRHRQRRARIDDAYRSALHAVNAQAKKKKAQYHGDLQMRHFRAERQKPVDEKALEARSAEFGVRLAELGASVTKTTARARRWLSGYGAFRRMLRATADEVKPEEKSRDQWATALQESLATAHERLAEFARPPVAIVFGYAHPALIAAIIILGAGLPVFLRNMDWSSASLLLAPAVGLLMMMLFIYWIAGRKARPSAEAAAAALVRARAEFEACRAAAVAEHERSWAALQERYVREFKDIEESWTRGDEVERRHAHARRQKLETQIVRVLQKHEQPLQARLAAAHGQGGPRLQALEEQAAARRDELSAWQEAELAKIAADEDRRWAELEELWQRDVLPAYAELQAMSRAAEAEFPSWSAVPSETWQPPLDFPRRVKLGRLEVALPALPVNSRLSLPGEPRAGVPVSLTFGERGSLLVESAGASDARVMGAFNNLLLRLFENIPPGKLSVTIIDPVGLGQNFAGLMHLGDYEESLINRRIWTQRDQIEERLGELNEHIEKVIQMYLRSEFATIVEYNATAGSVAEKYHLLVIADFPAGFSETAVKRLQSIAASGPRCGVFTLIHWDQRQVAPDGLVPDDLRRHSICIKQQNGSLALEQPAAPQESELTLDPAPESSLAAALVHQIGKRSVDSNRVEVPFTNVAPRDEDMWTGDTTTELRVAVGRTGATKLQYLAIGKGTRQHALFAGKTGSGKSTLFHVIITNLALTCSPAQVEFYLIDFKKGVEFKCYASKRLPHARVVAIESDREFGLSVLQRVDEELKRRGDLFRRLNVQDIPGYKRAGGAEPMPRSLLIIDEFQEFFVQDDTIAQNASLLFDRIVRQGRAFGIHVLLGSQTLGGAYTLARATLGQMVIRVALQCNEADAYLIMDDSNPAPRLLSRPGEGIYNDAAGAVEGNSPFQVVWLPDQERDEWLDKVNARAAITGVHHDGPVIFEGNAPADVSENAVFRELLAHPAASAPMAPRFWLGAPNAIKGPTEVVFHRQSGNHLLMVGQRDETALTLFALSLLALSAQYPVGAAKFVFISGAVPGTAEADFLERVLRAIPHEVRRADGHSAAEAVGELAAELKERQAAQDHGAAAPPLLVFVHGLQRFKKLRHEDDFSFSSSADEGASAGAQFGELLTEGSSHGIHLLVSIDTFANVNRFLSRRAIGEFEYRVLFQMSANDSASLIDSPQASNLGLYRALLYNEQQGSAEIFRPYAVPGAEFLH